MYFFLCFLLRKNYCLLIILFGFSFVCALVGRVLRISLFQSGGGTENELGLIDMCIRVCVCVCECWNYQQTISVLCNSWASPMG